jgi:starch synthase (maltosyl-transferring)
MLAWVDSAFFLHGLRGMADKKQGTKTATKPSAVRVDRSRVIIEAVQPEIDCGRFPIKRVVGEEVLVEADVFIDGHEALSCALLYRKKGASRWQEKLMTELVNDRWSASFTVADIGRYEYTVVAWHDPFKGWRRDFIKRVEAEQDVSVDLLIGAQMVAEAAERAPKREVSRLERVAEQLRGEIIGGSELAVHEELALLMTLHADRENATQYDRVLEVVVDPVQARFSTWYELFPRSASADEQHGTFRDVEGWLPHIAALGFDVLYMPPIHPIGETFRKGRNNTLTPGATDVGSPWAIGARDGGHKDIHAQLGTIKDFQRLRERAREFGIEIALDIAFQASPDHPYVKKHPEWFKQRPDGTIQYAENPPKKYQDIYPFDFDTEDAKGLWAELRNVFEYWIEQGVRIFRVDNPHTKPFAFWEWCITSLKAQYPDLIFLSEAFTRPKVMYRLAKLGFTQSYTYFAWRNEKWDLTEYFTELTTTNVREFFRPNLWPNTPDILTEYLQTGGRSAFTLRLVLAATFGASYGIYGPAFEHMEHLPLVAGKEEYLNSEKYQLRTWDLNSETSLAPFIAKINRIRKENPALQTDQTLRFHTIQNEQLIAYSKQHERNFVLTVTNLDLQFPQSGWVQLPLAELGLDPQQPFLVEDLLNEKSYEWHGEWNYVELNPQVTPAHIFRITLPETVSDAR